MLKYPLTVQNRMLTYNGYDLSHYYRPVVVDMPAYSVVYRFKDNEDDGWTKKVNRLKQNDEKALPVFIDIICANQEIRGKIIHPCCGIGMISSSDHRLDSNKVVYRLGKTICDFHEISWSPSIISQTPHPPLHGIGSFHEREAAVRDTHVADRSVFDHDLNSVILFDDICTVGATYREALRALRSVYPTIKRCICVSVGKSESQKYHATKNGVTLANDHIC